MYAVLFTIFYAFCGSDDYCGQDRFVLKSLLETLHEVLCEALNVEEDVNVGFFLTLVESRITSRIPKDKYNIKALKKLMSKE